MRAGLSGWTSRPAWVLASLAAAGPALVAIAAPFRALASVACGHAEAVVALDTGLARQRARRRALLPFALLFLSADAAFAGFAGDLPLPSAASLPARVGTLGLILAAALGLGLAARVRARIVASYPTPRRLAFAEWVIPLALLNTLFLAFVASSSRCSSAVTTVYCKRPGSPTPSMRGPGSGSSWSSPL